MSAPLALYFITIDLMTCYLRRRLLTIPLPMKSRCRCALAHDLHMLLNLNPYLCQFLDMVIR